MTLYAVVPVKKLDVSKRRLSTVLTPQERRQLTLAMLEDVLTALKTSIVNETVVIGEDSEVEIVAKKFGASYLSASKDGLNPAIEEATEWCTKHGAYAILILPADVPLLTTKDINRIIALGVGNCSVVLSPSSNWGTNAMYQSPPRVIPASFGPKSFIEHIREAYNREVSVRLHFSPGLSLDIDSAENLQKLFELSIGTMCKKALEQITLDSQKARDFFAQKT